MTWHQVGQLGQQLCWFLLLLTPRFCKPGTSTYPGQIAEAYLLFVNAELTVLSCSVWVRLGLESPITQRKMQSLVTLATCNLSLSIVSTLLKRDYRMCYLMIMWVGNRKKKEWGRFATKYCQEKELQLSTDRKFCSMITLESHLEITLEVQKFHWLILEYGV